MDSAISCPTASSSALPATSCRSSTASGVSGSFSNNQGLTLVPGSAQLELTLPFPAPLKLTVSPISPNVTNRCVPKMLKLSSNVSVVSRMSSS